MIYTLWHSTYVHTGPQRLEKRDPHASGRDARVLHTIEYGQELQSAISAISAIRGSAATQYGEVWRELAFGACMHYYPNIIVLRTCQNNNKVCVCVFTLYFFASAARPPRTGLWASSSGWKLNLVTCLCIQIVIQVSKNTCMFVLYYLYVLYQYIQTYVDTL